MTKTAARKTTVCVLGLLLGLVGGLAQPRAQQATFTGEYTIHHATETGETVTLLLALRLTNQTNDDLVVSRLSVRDSAEPSLVYEALPHVALPSRRPVVVTATVTVAAAEFARWNEAGRPAVAVEMDGPDGQVEAAWVDLVPGDVQ